MNDRIRQFPAQCLTAITIFLEIKRQKVAQIIRSDNILHWDSPTLRRSFQGAASLSGACCRGRFCVMISLIAMCIEVNDGQHSHFRTFNRSRRPHPFRHPTGSLVAHMEAECIFHTIEITYGRMLSTPRFFLTAN